MTTILAITTVGAPGGICLRRGDDCWERTFELRGTRYSQILLSEIHQVLRQAQLEITDLEAITVCTGPGSFTGIRVGMAVARGLAFATEIPIVGVRAFEALEAVHRQEDTGLALLLEARRGEVYACFAEPGEALGGLPLAALEPEAVRAGLIERAKKCPYVIAGDALALYRDQWNDIQDVLESKRTHGIAPGAVADLGLKSLAHKNGPTGMNEVLPVYIRRAV